MKTCLLLLCLCAGSLALPSSDLYQRWGHKPAVDPLGSHCFDVTVDTTDTKAKAWLSANEYLYTAWKVGLCDPSVYPVVEESDHPGVTTKVTRRKSGHAEDMNSTSLAFVSDLQSSDCRTDKTTTAEKTVFTNAAGVSVKIRGCQNGFACKPYVDCELALPDKATQSVIFDKSFKFFVFTYKGPDAGKETELYPDANLHFPDTYTINAPTAEVVSEVMQSDDEVYIINSVTPGNHAHCYALSFVGGKNNKYYQSHGYQYQPPIWNPGFCDKRFNWFNQNITIDPTGDHKLVTETEMGVH